VAIGPESQGSDAAQAASEKDVLVLEASEEAAAAEQAEEEAEGDWEEELEAESRPGSNWFPATLAILAVLGWTAFFGWVNQAEMLAGASAAQWQGWIVSWCVPVLLVIGLWLLTMRNSRREAVRFGNIAHMLSQESALLENRLTVVNRELSLAREFIAAQSRDLESLGRLACDRLSKNADELQGLIVDNGAQLDAIAKVSTTAVENMGQLRNELPVISNSSRDVSNQIANVGQVARVQLDELIAGMKRVNEFGEASERQMDSLRTKVGEAVTSFEQQADQLGQIADTRFTALNERSVAFRAEMDGREVDALEAIRRRADALEAEIEARAKAIEAGEDAALQAMRKRSETLEEELEAQRRALAAMEESSLDVLRGRLSQLREEGTRLADILREGEADAAEAWSAAVTGLEERMFAAIRRIADVDQQALGNARKRLEALSSEAGRVDAMIVERFEAFETQLAQRDAQAAEREAAAIAELEQHFASLDARVAERQEEHLAHVAGLAERGDALAERLGELGYEIERISTQGRAAQDGLTDAAHILAEKLSESRAILNDNTEKVSSLTDASVRLLEIIRSGAQHSSEELPKAIGEAEQRLVAFREHAGALRDVLADAGEKSASLAGNVETAQRSGRETYEQLTLLEARLADLAKRSDALSDQARNELGEAIALLEERASHALGKLGQDQAEAIREIAEQIGESSNEAIGQAVKEHAEKALRDLQTAASEAGEAGRETAIQLRDQLAMVNELAGNLERRVAHARERAEEKVDNDFTRRMALITESLNSNAIDIAKAFDTEVTDTAWSNYLRGDRGIFTRRAVRLLDNHDSKAIAEIYSEDQQFRETVNRYIHDFEAMLRSVLSTRDGNALAVTVLSSEIGKLYVALAQAIDRLRS